MLITLVEATDAVVSLQVTLPSVPNGESDPGNPRVDALSSRPAILAVAAGTDSPLTGASALFFTADGQPPVTAEDRP